MCQTVHDYLFISPLHARLACASWQEPNEVATTLASKISIGVGSLNVFTST